MQLTETDILKRLDELKAQRVRAEATVHAVDGAMQECERLLEIARGLEKIKQLCPNDGEELAERGPLLTCGKCHYQFEGDLPNEMEWKPVMPTQKLGTTTGALKT